MNILEVPTFKPDIPDFNKNVNHEEARQIYSKEKFHKIHTERCIECNITIIFFKSLLISKVCDSCKMKIDKNKYF